MGGTFTDIILRGSSGALHTLKISSTEDDFSRAIASGVARLLKTASVPAETVATNAILTRKGARTGLVTTKGFRDVLEIGRLRMPRLYDLRWQKPEALAGRRCRVEVEERVGSLGEVVTPLDEESVRRAARRLRAEGVESIAVCLINSYANAAHERRVAEILETMSACPDVSLSCDVLPEIREYERTSTTVINAYIKPVVKRYLDGLLRKLADMGIRASLLVMQSGGGVMAARSAAQRPIHIIESGPAAGVMAAQVLGAETGYKNLLTFDMGGTTAKAS
ncbi:unnamed protein product, partial [marine sediment metagenome]